MRWVHVVSRRLLRFAAGLQASRSLLKTSLDIYHTELAVLDFTMSRHGPQKTNAMTGNGDVGMKSAGYQNGVALAHHGRNFLRFDVVVDKLDTIGRLGHVEVHVNFF